MVAASIILLITDSLEPGHGDLELPNNIGHNGKDCAAVLATGLEIVNVSIYNSPPSCLVATVNCRGISCLPN